jgi:hypothetical protein
LPPALHENHPWGKPGIEPPLCEVLADPLVHAIMRCDRVSGAALKSVIVQAQRRLRQRRNPSSQPDSTTQVASIAEFRRVPVGTDIML